MTNYVTNRFISICIFIISAVFIFGITIVPVPFFIKLIVYSGALVVILIGVQSTTIRYIITNDTLITKGLGVSNISINFTDVRKAYIFVKSDVSKTKNSSSNSQGKTTYKINKHPYIGLELKNGAVVTLDILTVNKDFFALLEQKINEHNIYYFEMK